MRRLLGNWILRFQKHPVEAIIDQRVRDTRLYDLALRHRSDLRHEDRTESNERLEYLGDAVLGLVIARHLYLEFPDEEEGFLSSLRSKLVSGVALAEVAKRLDLGPLIVMSPSTRGSGGERNPTILADGLEALIGALYLDRGLASVERFIFRSMLQDADLDQLAATSHNHKGRLLEYAQARGWSQPMYHLARTRGPRHRPEFTIEVSVDGKVLGRAQGTSKKAASRRAAHSALKLLNISES